MKRLYCMLILWLAEWREVLAEVRAHDANRVAEDAEKELERASGWREVMRKKLDKAKDKTDRAQLALQRHDRHVELGIEN